MKNETNTVFGERLANARKMRCLSQRELSERLDIRLSANAIAKYETGKMMPTSEVQAALAIALGVDIDYFHHPFTVTIPASAWKFRKRASLGAKQIAAIQQMATDQMERIADIEQVCNINQPFQLDYSDTPVATFIQAEAMAQRIRNELGLGNAPIFTPIALLESLGFRIVEVEADSKFDGTSAMADHTPLLVLNATYEPERKRFTLFHEMAPLRSLSNVSASTARTSPSRSWSVCNVTLASPSKHSCTKPIDTKSSTMPISNALTLQ